MKFRITGEPLPEIKAEVKRFAKGIEEAWKPEIELAREKLKKLPLPVKVPDVPLPEDITITVWEEDGAVFLRVPVMLPGGRVWGKPRKKMEQNLRGWLVDKCEFKAKIKYAGD